MMKVLIQGLGETPTPIEFALKKERPNVTYIICSEYQLRHVCPGYTKSNWNVVTEAARKVNTKLIFKRCDVFDPKSIRNCLLDVLRKVDPSRDELVFNYTSGSAPVRLFLGVLGVQFSKFNKNTKVMYSIEYEKEGVEVLEDHTAKLNEFLPTDIDLLLGLYFEKAKGSKKGQR
jgi:hypothetical protein